MSSTEFAGARMSLVDRLRQKAGRVRERLFRGGSRSDVFRNMLVLVAGTGTAKAIGFVSLAAVTRLYSPEQFGLFSLFLSAATLAVPFTTLRYSAALPLPRTRTEAVNLLGLCLALVLLNSLLIGGVLALFAEPLFRWVAAPQLADIWPLLLLAIAGAGLYEVLTAWAVRQKRFAPMARAEVAQSLLGALAKVGLGAWGYLQRGLLVGHVVAQWTSCLMLAFGAARVPRDQWRRLTAGRVRFVARRHADFPVYRLPSQVLLMVSAQAPVLFVSASFGPAVAGQVGLALTVLAVPLMLVGQAAAQAYYAEIARVGRHDPARIHAISKDVLLRMLAVGAVPTLVLMIGAPWLFKLVFGVRWEQAGQFASVMALYLLVNFAANPLANALSVFKRNDLFLRFNVVRVVIIVGVFLACRWLQATPMMTIAAYSAALAFYYVLNVMAILKIVRGEIQRKLAAR